MNRSSLRYFRPAIFVFFFLNIVFFTLEKRLESWGFNQTVLVFGNIILFSIFLISFLMGSKGLQTKNGHVFFRWIYGSFMVKLFLLAGTAFAYILSARKDINKPALFFCMGLYVIYTIIEVSALMKLGKQKKNA